MDLIFLLSIASCLSISAFSLHVHTENAWVCTAKSAGDELQAASVLSVSGCFQTDSGTFDAGMHADYQ